MTNPIQTVPFNFDDIFTETRDLFDKAGFDTADGSNTSQLCAVLSYLITSLNTNTAFNINETLLPYATKRKNILQDARVLGYEPTHKISYQYRLTIRLDDKMCGYGSFTIPKYTTFTSNSNTYYYLESLTVQLGILSYNGIEINPDDLSFLNSGGGVTPNRFEATKVMYDNNDVTQEWKQVIQTFKNNRTFSVNVKEGNLISYNTDTATLERTIDSISLNGTEYTRNYIDIPYTDVENDGIECFVSYTDENANYQENVMFERTNDYFFEVDGDKYVNKKYIRLDDIEMGTPRVYFKYAGIGTGLPLGSIVRFNLLISKGTDGEMNTSYTSVNIDNEETLSYSGIELPSISNNTGNWITDVFDSAIITGCDLIQSGTNEESTRSIVENAPKVYNSAYRLITNIDFRSACNRSSYVSNSVVWGGEDEFPKAPGHIWFSFLPQRTSNRTFSSNSDNSLYKRNNVELTYNYAEGDTKYQYQLRQDYYQRNYLLNTEIQNYSIYKDSSGVHKKYAGVWGELEGKYVPGLVFHHRHPLYLNFNYVFTILRYNLENTVLETHEKLFNILDNCFNGNDSINLEKFETEYFHTNIVKRIDFAISDLCGFTSDVETQIVLNEKTCCMENWHPEYKDIFIPLAVPFEKYFTDDGFLDTSRLPNIDTEKFINMKFGDVTTTKVTNTLITGDLYTDWSRIKNDQTNRKELIGTDDRDYTDIATRLFVVPIKIKMKCSFTGNSILLSADNLMPVRFMIAPNNDADESFNNFVVKIYNDKKLKYTFSNNSEYKFSNFFNLYWKTRKDLYFTDDFKRFVSSEDTIVLEYTRTCGYYYLFNGFKKEILIHLFVNGMYEGFTTAVNGMKKNDYYDHYIEKINETYLYNETYLNDDTNYVDITYTRPRSYIYHSTPRSYLCTVDKMYLTSVEATGEEMESEQHLFNHDQYGLPIINTDFYNDYLSSVYSSFVNGDDRILDGATENNYNYGGADIKGHYLTTEGYISDNTEFNNYCGAILRAYNENCYLYTPLTFDLFKQNVYLNLKYPSDNFGVLRNVIPRLNTVKFKNATEKH